MVLELPQKCTANSCDFCRAQWKFRERKTAMSLQWKKSLESLRVDFLDLSRSYPKLFFARLIGPLVSESIWKSLLGEKKYVRRGWRPIRGGLLDHACIYSTPDADAIMCTHALTRLDHLSENAARALCEIPKQLLGTYFPSESSEPSAALWLAFLDHLASIPGPVGQTRVFQREQLKVVQPEEAGSPMIRVPLIAQHFNPHLFPAVAFPHQWLALLSPDIATCSAAAIDELFQKLPNFSDDFTCATWVEPGGARMTWTVPDRAMLGDVIEERGEPAEIFANEGIAASGTSLIYLLESIPTGTAEAHNYHKCIARIARRLFHPDLTGMTFEQEINDGRKRIDLCFDNVAERGFFHELKVAHQIKCPVVFMECKNYASDPGNPEIDQLQGRFARQRGIFGILICRQVENRETLLRRCRDVANGDRGYVIVLTDSDVKQLWQLRTAQNDDGFNEYLREKFKQLIM